MTWVVNYIHYEGFDVITHPCPNFNGSFTKHDITLKLGQEWVVISQKNWDVITYGCIYLRSKILVNLNHWNLTELPLVFIKLMLTVEQTIIISEFLMLLIASLIILSCTPNYISNNWLGFQECTNKTYFKLSAQYSELILLLTSKYYIYQT